MLYRRFKIGARLGAAFSLLTLLLVAIVAVALNSAGSLRQTADKALQHDAAMALNATRIGQLALEERRYEKDTFINIANPEKTASYKQKWDDARTRLDTALDAGEAMAVSAETRSYYQNARSALAEYATGFQHVYSGIRDGELTTATQANQVFSQYKASIYQLEDMAAKIDDAAQAQMESAQSSIDAQYELSRLELLAFAALALVAAGVLAVSITRSITRPLRDAIGVAQTVARGDLSQQITVTGRDEASELLGAMRDMSTSLSRIVASLRQSSHTVHASADEIRSGSEELASRTDQQAASIEETASAMEEMTATVKHNTDATHEVEQLAGSATQSAQSSAEDVERSNEMMAEIAAHSQKMDEILETIDAIAFQTNILALNASVEAARAGDKGRGFAVVATEVRALAARSADSAKDIRSLLEQTRSKVDAGSAQAERSGRTNAQTREVIDQLAERMSAIAVSTREQAQGIEQINIAISQLDSVTQQNAALGQQSNAAAQLLAGQAETLAELVAEFRLAADTQTGPAVADTDTSTSAARLPTLSQAM